MTTNRFLDLATKKLGNEIAADELKELQTYLEDVKYQRLYTWLDARWAGSIDSKAAYDTEAELEKLTKRIEAEASQKGWIARPVWLKQGSALLRIAATLLLLLGGAWLTNYFLMDNSRVQKDKLEVVANGSEILEVKEGEAPQKLALSEGSNVWLNSGSSLVLKPGFGKDHRQVELKGEAFFEVKRDTTRPFVIKHGTIQTRVLGTSFNITAFESEDLMVAVKSGRVEVSSLEEEKRFVLQPEEQLRVDEGSQFWKKAICNPSKITSWREDELWFDNFMLLEALPRFERRFGLRIELGEASTGKCILVGKLSTRDIWGVLRSLKSLHDIDYEYISSEKRLILMGGDCAN